MCPGPWQYTFVNVLAIAILFAFQKYNQGGGQNPPTKNEGATVKYVKFLGEGGDVKSF